MSDWISKNTYLCESFMLIALKNKWNNTLAKVSLGLSKEKGDCLAPQAVWKPGLLWSLLTVPADGQYWHCYSWIQGPNAIFCFSLWAESQSIHFFHLFDFCLYIILHEHYTIWRREHWVVLEAMNHIKEREGGSIYECMHQSELLSLSSITFFFLSVLLGSALIEFKRVSAFLRHLQCLALWLVIDVCAAFVFLACHRMPRNSLGRCGVSGQAWGLYLNRNS